MVPFDYSYLQYIFILIVDPFPSFISLYRGFSFSCNNSSRKNFDYSGSVRFERKRESGEGYILYVDRSADAFRLYMGRLFDDLSVFGDKFSLYIYFYRFDVSDGIYKEEVCKAAGSYGTSFPHMVAVRRINGGAGYGSIWIQSVLDRQVYTVDHMTFF